MLDFINKPNLLYEHQFGFRPSHSTVFALIKLLDQITHAIDSKKQVCSIVIYFKKAFDTVDHNILLSKLNYMVFEVISKPTCTAIFSIERNLLHCLTAIPSSILSHMVIPRAQYSAQSYSYST